VGGQLVDDPENQLEGEWEQLSREELRERLLVAERVMKSLFQRNKELELRVDGSTPEAQITASTDPPPSPRPAKRNEQQPSEEQTLKIEELQLRLEETMAEARRHCENFKSVQTQFT
jgi:hypothetical protein